MFEEDLTEMTDRQLLERIARDSRRAKLTSMTSFYAILVGIVTTAWGISKVTEAFIPVQDLLQDTKPTTVW